MSNETAKMRDDVRVWGLTSTGENALGRKDGDGGRKNDEEQKGKEGRGESVRMRGRWIMEPYVG
jgi:hypothetical protein